MKEVEVEARWAIALSPLVLFLVTMPPPQLTPDFTGAVIVWHSV
jgi:hypothetical protein